MSCDRATYMNPSFGFVAQNLPEKFADQSRIIRKELHYIETLAENCFQIPNAVQFNSPKFIAPTLSFQPAKPQSAGYEYEINCGQHNPYHK